MKSILISLFIRMFGKLLLQLIGEMKPLIEQINNDPANITNEQKREAMLRQLKMKFSNEDKLVEKLFPLLDDIVSTLIKES